MEKARKYKSQIPNALTLLRIILIPLFIFLAIKEYYLSTFLVFIIASLTDAFDGIIARKFKYVSSFGKIFDPLADKILVASALIILTFWGLIYWWLTLLILARELFMTLLRNHLIKRKIYLAANIFGKIKTTAQMSTIIFSLFYKSLLPKSSVIENIILIAFILVTIITWFSAIIYVFQIRERLYAR